MVTEENFKKQQKEDKEEKNHSSEHKGQAWLFGNFFGHRGNFW